MSLIFGKSVLLAHAPLNADLAITFATCYLYGPLSTFPYQTDKLTDKRTIKLYYPSLRDHLHTALRSPASSEFQTNQSTISCAVHNVRNCTCTGNTANSLSCKALHVKCLSTTACSTRHIDLPTTSLHKLLAFWSTTIADVCSLYFSS